MLNEMTCIFDIVNIILYMFCHLTGHLVTRYSVLQKIKIIERQRLATCKKLV